MAAVVVKGFPGFVTGATDGRKTGIWPIAGPDSSVYAAIRGAHGNVGTATGSFSAKWRR